MPAQLNYWEKIFAHLKETINEEDMLYDNWLKKYASVLVEHKSSLFLDLGCGFGNSSLFLLKQEFNVFSLDLSFIACNWMKKISPGSLVIQSDFLSGLPFRSNTFSVIIADSSLHYFSNDEFTNILNEIYRVLIKGGLILLRVNSNKDINFGAGSGKEIEKNFYLLQNRYKKFFEKDELVKLFKDLNIIKLEEVETTRFGLVKHQWELFGKKI